MPLSGAAQDLSIVKDASCYIFVRVKVPVPVHPWVTPVKFHVPVIVLLFTVP